MVNLDLRLIARIALVSISLIFNHHLLQAQKKQVNELYEKALYAFNNNQIKESIIYANSALALDEWNTEVLYLRANAFELDGKISEAIIDYEKITLDDPGYLEAYLAKAILYYKQKNYETALKNIDEIENYDGFVETRAVLFRSQSYGSGSSGSISGVTSMQGLKNDITYYKGLIFRESKNLTKAREVFKNLIKREVKPEYYVALGITYEMMAKKDSAKFAYFSALKVDKNNNSAAYQLQLLDPDFTLPENFDTDEDFHYGLAKKAYEDYNKGNFESALQLYSKAIKIAPDESDYYASRGLVYEKLRQYDLAISDYDVALRKDSNFIVNHYRIGNVLYKQKKYEAAIARYTIYLSYVPDDVDILYNMGLAYLSLKKREEACQTHIVQYIYVKIERHV
ncbi:MAG: tetratricopeptide repeat protein [Bacteroidota bacterium]